MYHPFREQWNFPESYPASIIISGHWRHLDCISTMAPILSVLFPNNLILLRYFTAITLILVLYLIKLIYMFCLWGAAHQILKTMLHFLLFQTEFYNTPPPPPPRKLCLRWVNCFHVVRACVRVCVRASVRP